MTAVAVNVFEVDWMLKMVCGSIGRPPSASVEPKLSIQTGLPSLTSAMATPGMPSRSLIASTRSRADSMIG